MSQENLSNSAGPNCLKRSFGMNNESDTSISLLRMVSILFFARYKIQENTYFDLGKL